MASRITSAAVGIPLLLIVTWAGGLWFLALVSAAASIGALEMAAMARRRGRRPAGLFAAAWSAALVVAAYTAAAGGKEDAAIRASAALAVVSVAGLIAALPVVLWRSQPREAAADWAMTSGAALYPGILLAYAPLLRILDDGFLWVVILLGAVFTADTAAFFVGRRFGSRRMAPRISPGKTWEGTAAGLAAAGAACAILAAAVGLDLHPALAAGLGVVVGMVAVLGDLAESMVKRACGVKDSGALVPGHGGVLDRLDSIVFNLPLVYHFAAWTVQ